MSAFSWRSRAAVFLSSLITLSAAAQNATIVGRVYDNQANPVADATVTVVELRRSTQTGADGAFRFENIPPRHYHIRAESPRLGFTIGEAEVKAGETRTVEVVIDPLVHAEEIVVTASADSRRESEVYQPVNVLGEEELQERVQPTLGETLAQEPGVTSTFFGAGASRPVIRGLGADRVRVLEGGVGTGDVSNVSPDHAVSVDPASATQIEIVRGPATLLYGSNAVGGVVNVISERVPSQRAVELVSGDVDLRYGSAAEEKTSSVSLNGGRDALAFHADLTLRDTNDYEIPDAIVENSSTNARTITGGASWVSDRGYLGGAVTNFTTNYGIPGDEPVRIDLDQHRYDLAGELSQLGFF
ncbi:MAG: TonB-dependent receptor, partial [Thermoanaerobaculia bacterium]